MQGSPKTTASRAAGGPGRTPRGRKRVSSLAEIQALCQRIARAGAGRHIRPYLAAREHIYALACVQRGQHIAGRVGVPMDGQLHERGGQGNARLGRRLRQGLLAGGGQVLRHHKAGLPFHLHVEPGVARNAQHRDLGSVSIAPERPRVAGRGLAQVEPVCGIGIAYPVRRAGGRNGGCGIAKGQILRKHISVHARHAHAQPAVLQTFQHVDGNAVIVFAQRDGVGVRRGAQVQPVGRVGVVDHGGLHPDAGRRRGAGSGGNIAIDAVHAHMAPGAGLADDLDGRLGKRGEGRVAVRPGVERDLVRGKDRHGGSYGSLPHAHAQVIGHHPAAHRAVAVAHDHLRPSVFFGQDGHHHAVVIFSQRSRLRVGRGAQVQPVGRVGVADRRDRFRQRRACRHPQQDEEESQEFAKHETRSFCAGGSAARGKRRGTA